MSIIDLKLPKKESMTSMILMCQKKEAYVPKIYIILIEYIIYINNLNYWNNQFLKQKIK